MTFSDSQRRTLLRTLFVALGVLPLGGTLAWAWVVHSGGHRTLWERGLGPQLGMRVSIEKIRHPRPGVVLFERFRLYDPETDALVFDCRRLEVEEFSDGRHLRADQPEIFAHHGGTLFAALQRRLQRETFDVERATTFDAAELTWHTAAASQTLVAVQGLVGPAESAQQLLVNFRLPDTSPEHPVSLRVVRGTAGEAPETSIELDTGAVMLPGAMFGSLSEAAIAFGRVARYSGRSKLRYSPAGWSGLITGDVVDVDFDALVSTRFPHLLSGSGEVRIHRAELTDGRLDLLHATVLAGPGQISRSFVEAAGKHLNLAASTAPPPETSMLLFDHLAFDATFNDGGLSIKGRTAERPGAILWKDDVTYWHEPPAAMSAANLLRALVPERELLVPAAWQTARLLQWLPLPQVRPSEPSNALPQATRIRLREPDETLPR